MRKLTTLLTTLTTVVLLATTLTACANTNNASGENKQTTTTRQETKKEPLNLTGTWKTQNNNGSWQEAVIDDTTITINWMSDNGNTKSLYWKGTYQKPTTTDTTYKWTSQADKDANNASLLASTDDSKEFTYTNNEITYQTSALGATTTNHLTKQ